MTDLNATWNEALRGPRMSEATGRVIFKYQMPVLEEFTMDLPRGAEIIRTEDQGGMFWMWAIVNTDAPTETRFFKSFKTGAKMPDNVELKYIGFCKIFVQMELGLYMFEDLDAKRRHDFNVATEEQLKRGKSRIVKEFAERNGLDVIDIKLSVPEPGDMLGAPMPETEVKPFAHYMKDSPRGEFFDWGSFACDVIGYNIYEKPPEGTKARYIMDIDEVLLEFEDVFRPMLEEQRVQKWRNEESNTRAWLQDFCARLDNKRAKFTNKWSQNAIDEIEAQGGFEEEEA